MTNTGLGFGVLGPLAMTVNGTHMPLGAPKQRAVLAMLVINRNRPVSVDSLTNAVWGLDPVPAARTSIQSYVSTLRRLLRTAGVDPNVVLASAPPGYQLNFADMQCDLGRFISEKTAGTQAAAAGRFEEASAHLSAALGEWRGTGAAMTCATSRSSTGSLQRCWKTKWRCTPPAPKPRSRAGAPPA